MRMLGIVFAQPQSPIARDELYPALPYFHHRSGESADFYFAGFYQKERPPKDAVAVSAPDGGVSWVYSATDFNVLRQELEAGTRWRYSGGCDLLIMNVGLHEGQVAPDFEKGIALNLELMRQHGKLLTVGTFLERIFRHAESCDGSDPTWGFRTSEVVRAGGSALKEVILSFLPDEVRSDANAAMYYMFTGLK